MLTHTSTPSGHRHALTPDLVRWSEMAHKVDALDVKIKIAITGKVCVCVCVCLEHHHDSSWGLHTRAHTHTVLRPTGLVPKRHQGPQTARGSNSPLGTTNSENFPCSRMLSLFLFGLVEQSLAVNGKLTPEPYRVAICPKQFF